MFLAGIPIMALWGLYGPSAQGLMTQRVGRAQQGALQGALTSVAGLTGIIGPRLFAETFASFIGDRASWHLPGAPYLLAALLMLVSLAVAWRATRATRASETPRVPESTRAS